MKLEKHQMEKILRNWDIDKVLSFKKAQKGVVNHNWVVKTDKGKFILRGVSFDRKLSELVFEFKYISYFKEKNFPYNLPIPLLTTNKKKLVRSGKNYFWLYEFIEGSIKSNFGKNELMEIAKMLAKYHDILEKSNLNNKQGKIEPFLRKPLLKEAEDYKNKIKKKKVKSNKDKIFLKEVEILIPIMKKLEGRTYSELKQYPVHRDINPENILFEGKKLVGVIDFDNVGIINDVFLKDIAVLLQQGCTDYRKRLNFSNARYFIKEYKKHRNLNIKEIALLPEMISAIFIEDFNYVYWMILNDPERVKLNRLKRYSNAAQWYWKNRKKIFGKLK